MRKSIILSGPQGSGKTLIASAIASTHPKAIHISARDLHKIQVNPGGPLITTPFSIAIIDECSWEDIIKISSVKYDIPVVYLTQAHVDRGRHFDWANVIYCNHQD